MLNKKTVSASGIKKKIGIGAKIKDYMKDVTIDVFNYEKTVSDNITNYFKELAEENDIDASRINVRISKKPNLLAYVYDGNVILKESTTKELIVFFMGKGSHALFDLEKRVEINVSNYLSDYAAVSGIQSNNLIINISKPAQEVIVMAYSGNRFIGRILLKDLIIHFKS